MKILYVENHTVFARTVAQQFLASHEVTIVSSIAAGRETLAKETFDLALVDYDLDDGKGDEFVRECLKAQPQIKVIASSSHNRGNDAMTAAGACAVCSKMRFDRIQT